MPLHNRSGTKQVKKFPAPQENPKFSLRCSKRPATDYHPDECSPILFFKKYITITIPSMRASSQLSTDFRFLNQESFFSFPSVPHTHQTHTHTHTHHLHTKHTHTPHTNTHTHTHQTHTHSRVFYLGQQTHFFVV